jgi:hypothetical protein
MPKHAELIDRLYKFANKVLEVDLMGVYRQPPTLQKNAGWTPNPESEIAKLFEKYASLYADVQDARAEHANLKSYQEHAEDQLRKMIIDGEW